MSAVSRPTGPDTLDIEVILANDHACLYLVGEFDLATAPMFDEALTLACDHSPTTLVVDLARLTFIDSSGLDRLVVALTHQCARGGEMVLRSPQASILRVLEIAGLTGLLAIV